MGRRNKPKCCVARECSTGVFVLHGHTRLRRTSGVCVVYAAILYLLCTIVWWQSTLGEHNDGTQLGPNQSTAATHRMGPQSHVAAPSRSKLTQPHSFWSDQPTCCCRTWEEAWRKPLLPSKPRAAREFPLPATTLKMHRWSREHACLF